MKIIYTDTFNVTATPVLIQKANPATGQSPGNGLLPNRMITAISIRPVSASDAILANGLDPSSNWVQGDAGEGFVCEHLNLDDAQIIWIKSAGTVSVKLIAEGN
jgi:hypothetical protein